jgi:DNA invertase Pin-like site-specific DNA recombinase
VPARSRQFRRVSTTKQDADKQIADLDAWDASHDYTPGPAYVADGESAYHLKHLARLEQALDDIRADAFDVLTFWKTDRMWRGKSAARAVYLIEQIEEAGGTVEFVTEPHLNFNPAIPKIARDQMLMGAFGASHAESKAKADRTHMDIASKKATGSAHGRAPWGYAVQCQTCGKITQRLEDGSVDRCGHKDNKRFVPTDVGRRWIPVIYDLVLDGHSLRNIAEYLTVNKVPTTSGKIWHEAFLAQLAANPAYKGTRRGGGPNMELEALVGPTMWDEAQLAIASRARIGRKATTQPKALLRPVCGRCFGVKREGCTDGISPMYRQQRGPRAERVKVYRCFGHGPQRIGCGAEIPVTQLDAAVIAMISGDTRRHTESVFVPGDDHADQISRLREKGAEAMRQGDYDRATRCMQEAAELEKQPSTRPHWDEVELDITRGQHFQSLDSAAQRDYLQKWRPVARIADGRLLIDLDAFTDEHGVKIGLRTDGSTAPAFSINGTSEQVRVAVVAGDRS